MALVINEKCIRCGICEHVCFLNAVSLPNGSNYYTIDSEKCKNCCQCMDMCPMLAIEPADQNQRRIEKIEIIKEKCTGCSLCAKNCPVKAINGEIKQPYVIDERKCILCGVCADT